MKFEGGIDTMPYYVRHMQYVLKRDLYGNIMNRKLLFIVDIYCTRRRQLKTARGYIIPPPLCVCNGLASPADAACRMYCEICEDTRYVAALGLRR